MSGVGLARIERRLGARVGSLVADGRQEACTRVVEAREVGDEVESVLALEPTGIGRGARVAMPPGELSEPEWRQVVTEALCLGVPRDPSLPVW